MRKQFNSNMGKPCLEEQHDTVWKTKKRRMYSGT